MKKSLACYEKALEICKRFNDRNQIGNISNGLGIVYHNLGKYDEAIETYKKYLEIAEKSGNKLALPHA